MPNTEARPQDETNLGYYDKALARLDTKDATVLAALPEGFKDLRDHCFQKGYYNAQQEYVAFPQGQYFYSLVKDALPKLVKNPDKDFAFGSVALPAEGIRFYRNAQGNLAVGAAPETLEKILAEVDRTIALKTPARMSTGKQPLPEGFTPAEDFLGSVNHPEEKKYIAGILKNVPAKLSKINEWEPHAAGGLGPDAFALYRAVDGGERLLAIANSALPALREDIAVEFSMRASEASLKDQAPLMISEAARTAQIVPTYRANDIDTEESIQYNHAGRHARKQPPRRQASDTPLTDQSLNQSDVTHQPEIQEHADRFSPTILAIAKETAQAAFNAPGTGDLLARMNAEDRIEMKTKIDEYLCIKAEHALTPPDEKSMNAALLSGKISISASSGNPEIIRESMKQELDARLNEIRELGDKYDSGSQIVLTTERAAKQIAELAGASVA